MRYTPIATNRERLSTASQSTTDALEALSDTPSPLVWRLTITASISGFLFGYDTGYISSVLVSIGNDLGGDGLSIKDREYISSATSFGALIASIFAGLLADIIGRKYTVILCDALFIVGTVLQYAAGSVKLMIVGRLIMGLGVGIGSLCAPLYITELSPSRFRGRLVTINCLAITGGQLIAYAVGALLSPINSGWRFTVALSLLPCLIQFASILFLPDTPRYLIMKGRFEDAYVVLKAIYPMASESLINMNIDELHALNTLWDGVNSNVGKLKSSFKELFSKPSNLRSLTIACALQAAQQFVGFNALMYFSSSIFEMVGFENSTLVSCFIAGTNFITTILAILIIDKVGRRNILLISVPLLLISQIICAVSFSHMDISMQTLHNDGNDDWKYPLLTGLILFVAFYSIGLGNVPWQQSELFPQKVRGLGSSFSTATNWFGSMLVSFCFLTLMDTISPSMTFLLFAGNTFLAFLFIYFLYPELTGLQLEEVQNLLSDGFNVEKSVEMYQDYKNYHPLQ